MIEDKPSRCVVFDMGNVILPFDHMKPCRILSTSLDISAESIYEKIFKGGLESDFETGKINGGAFYNECKKALNFQIKLPEFKKLWSDIFDENKEVAVKCDLCSQRLKNNEEPACSLVCSTRCIHWGGMTKITREREQMVAR